MGTVLEMSYLNPEPTFYDCKLRENIPDTLLGFLRMLTGLTIIDVKGIDQRRYRVVTTLIHGNEPSGIIACHLWLKGQEIPATNIRIIICNPEAAKTKPFFTNRYLANSDDLNRFFSATSTDSTESPHYEVLLRAKKIQELVREVSPEAIVDLHNTSGSSPAFSVSVSEENKHLKLVELFTDLLILTQLNVGAIMEQCFDAPIVTIECGGANENMAHQVATNGLQLFFHKKNLFDQRKATVVVRKHPIRIELIGDASVGFCHHRLPTTDITLRTDIEELNHSITPSDEFIGWCDKDQPFMFKAINDAGYDQINDLFENRDGCIFTRQKMQLFMVTTTPEIATKDCLFYYTEA